MFKEIIRHGKACGERQGGPRRQDLCCIRHYCCQQTCLQLLLSQCCLTWPGKVLKTEAGISAAVNLAVSLTTARWPVSHTQLSTMSCCAARMQKLRDCCHCTKD